MINKEFKFTVAGCSSTGAILGAASGATLAKEQGVGGAVVAGLSKLGSVWAPATRNCGRFVGETIESIFPSFDYVYRSPEKAADLLACLRAGLVDKMPWKNLSYIAERRPNAPWPAECWDGRGDIPAAMHSWCPDPRANITADSLGPWCYGCVYATVGISLGVAVGILVYKSPKFIAWLPQINENDIECMPCSRLITLLYNKSVARARAEQQRREQLAQTTILQTGDEPPQSPQRDLEANAAPTQRMTAGLDQHNAGHSASSPDLHDPLLQQA